MDPITILAAFNAAMSLAKTLAPEIEALARKGEISAEAQLAVRTQLDALRDAKHFTGPEWEVSSQG